MDKTQLIKDIDRLKELISGMDDAGTLNEYTSLMEVSNLLTTITSQWSTYITGDLMASALSKLGKASQ